MAPGFTCAAGEKKFVSSELSYVMNCITEQCDAAVLTLLQTSCSQPVITDGFSGCGRQTYSFRRGTRPAAIHSLAFSPASVRPALLCAASGHGTVHLYRLEEHERCVAPPPGHTCLGLPCIMCRSMLAFYRSDLLPQALRRRAFGRDKAARPENFTQEPTYANSMLMPGYQPSELHLYIAHVRRSCAACAGTSPAMA